MGKYIYSLKQDYIKKYFYLWLIIFIVLNTYVFYKFPQQEIKNSDDPSKNQINKILKNEYLADNYIYVVVDWGMYYYQALYGDKNQAVIYIEPYKPAKYSNILREMAQKNKRKLLFIYNKKSGSETILTNQAGINLKNCLQVNRNSVWQIILEDDNSSKNICFK